MTRTRWSSKDYYHSLVMIEDMVKRLPCRGLHDDDGKGWLDLLDVVRAEREEAAFRANRAALAAGRRARTAKGGE
jgi:hypothetical protein